MATGKPLRKSKTENSEYSLEYAGKKKVKNILGDPTAALVCWSGLDGRQIKGNVEYQIDGELFNEISEWAATQFPDRTVHGILLLTPHEVYPISART